MLFTAPDKIFYFILPMCLLLSGLVFATAPYQDSQAYWEKARQHANAAWQETRKASQQAWEATKKDSKEIWDNTKEVSAQAWETTKQDSKELWYKTQELSSKAMQKTCTVIHDKSHYIAEKTAESEIPVEKQ